MNEEDSRERSEKLQFTPGAHDLDGILIYSLLFGPWLGMIMNHQPVKGLIYLVPGALAIYTTLYQPGSIALASCIALIAWFIFGLLDVYFVGSRLKAGKPVGPFGWQ